MEMDSESESEGQGSRKSRRTTSAEAESLKPPEMVAEEEVRRGPDGLWEASVTVPSRQHESMTAPVEERRLLQPTRCLFLMPPPPLPAVIYGMIFSNQIRRVWITRKCRFAELWCLFVTFEHSRSYNRFSDVHVYGRYSEYVIVLAFSSYSRWALHCHLMCNKLAIFSHH